MCRPYAADPVPRVQRRTWYVPRHLITDGIFENFEPVVMYEQFDPTTVTGEHLYTRTIVGLDIPRELPACVRRSCRSTTNSATIRATVPEPWSIR
ncbi:MAG: hypothetical protein U0231_16235 [Nitrospiraceae bacterium]